MRCAALSARTLALPVTKSLKVSEGSTPDALTSKPAIVCGAGAGAGRLAGVSTGALSLAAARAARARHGHPRAALAWRDGAGAR
jgi:hypothetical protein